MSTLWIGSIAINVPILITYWTITTIVHQESFFSFGRLCVRYQEHMNPAFGGLHALLVI